MRQIFVSGWSRKIAITSGLALIALFIYTQFSGGLAVRFGGLVWIPVTANTFWLPKSISLAMGDPVPDAVAGAMGWKEIEKGFEVAELPALVGDFEVDRIHLARIDPSKFMFTVLSDPSGSKDLDSWMKFTGAALVVNGSYYSPAGTPSTPIVSNGKLLGPAQYDSKHGAFVFSGTSAGIRDLVKEDWHTVFAQSEAAMVSYPLLLDADGSTGRVPKGTGWLANRSFVGEDRSGRIIVGTTKGAFFSLDRFAEFLKRSPLNLTAALNLDGGPVACQGIKLNGFERKSYGRWELQVDNGKAKVLPPSVLQAAPMTIILAVLPRR